MVVVGVGEGMREGVGGEKDGRIVDEDKGVTDRILDPRVE
jgi:hypothetical protein